MQQIVEVLEKDKTKKEGWILAMVDDRWLHSVIVDKFCGYKVQWCHICQVSPGDNSNIL